MGLTSPVAEVRKATRGQVDRMPLWNRRAIRTVEIHFEDPVSPGEFTGLPGVSDVVVAGPMLRCTVDGRLGPLIRAAARHEIVDLLSTEPNLEETFLSFYYTQSEGTR